MKSNRLLMALAALWSLLIFAIGWPSVRLPGGELWWSAVATLGAWTVAPWIVLWLVKRRNKSKTR